MFRLQTKTYALTNKEVSWLWKINQLGNYDWLGKLKVKNKHRIERFIPRTGWKAPLIGEWRMGVYCKNAIEGQPGEWIRRGNLRIFRT